MKFYLVSRADDTYHDEIHSTFVVRAKSIEEALELCTEEGIGVFNEDNVSIIELKDIDGESKVISGGLLFD